MFKKNEMKILEKLIENIALELTISDISKELKQKYAQTYRSIKSLHNKSLVKIKKIGKSKVIKLDFSKYYPEYVIAEIQRRDKIIKNKDIALIFDKILDIDKQYICILFGSRVKGNHKKNSDIDLLFIIPEEYDIVKFERNVRNLLSIYKADINVISKKSLFEMWANPGKLNVGNELLKDHIVLYGSEAFINLMRKHYVG